MKTEDFALFDRWIDNLKDLMDFEIVPVRSSAEVGEIMGSAGILPAPPGMLPDGRGST